MKLHALFSSCWIPLLALALSGCGDGESPVPDATPDPKEQAAPAPQPAAPEVFEAARFFVHLGPEGHVALTFGTREQQGELLAAGQLGSDAAGVAESLRDGLRRKLDDPASGKPVLMLITGPQTPWRNVGPILEVAQEPEVDVRNLDFRLPWDAQPRPLELYPATDAQAALEIEVHPAQAPARAEVRVGKSGRFLLYDTATEADRTRHMKSITALRAALQGFASTWKDETRRAHIHVVTAPGTPAYIHVLAVARVCREKRFSELRFTLAETDAAGEKPAK